MANYTLTQAADADIESLVEFGIEQFGITQAITYLEGLKAKLDTIALR